MGLGLGLGLGLGIGLGLKRGRALMCVLCILRPDDSTQLMTAPS